MKFLHMLKPTSIIHRGLRAANVLLSASDFGSTTCVYLLADDSPKFEELMYVLMNGRTRLLVGY